MEREEDFRPEDVRMNFRTLTWAIGMAWKMSPVLLTCWTLLTVACAVLPAVFTGMVSRTVDVVEQNVSGGRGMESIAGALAALACIMIFNGVFTQLPNLLWTKISNTFNVGMQRVMGRFLRTVPVKYFDDVRTAKIMQAAQRKENTLGRYVNQTLTFLQKMVYLLSTLVLAANTSYVLVIVTAVFSAVVLAIGTYDAKKAYGVWNDLEDDEFYTDYYMNLAAKKNPADLRVLGMGGYLHEKWDAHRKHIRDTYIRFQKNSELVWTSVNVLSGLTKCALLFAGLFLLKDGRLTLGGLTLFVSVLSQIGPQCEGVGYLWESFYEVGCDLELKKRMLLWDFSDKRPASPEGMCKPVAAAAGEAPVIFDLQHVSFSYDGEKKVLDDITLTIREGESIALVGENGAGKSTLVKILLGIYEPDEGELFFKGTNYRDLDMDKFVKEIGVVFQDFVHFELLARENIAFGDIYKVSDDAELTRAAALGGADKLLKKLPKGLDNYLGRWYEQEGGEMSGGEWQRVAVSRAYVSNRSILIMDEPAAALDPIAEMEQFYRIRNKLERRTSVLISHRIGFARLADRIVVLHDGKIAERGTHEELMKENGLYCEMFENQASWYQKEVSA